MVSNDLARLAVALIGLGLAVPAAAKITCCEINGKRTCGDPPPAQCYERERIEFGKTGQAKRIEAPPTPEQRAVREAEEERKKEEERLVAERARNDRILLGKYLSDKDIDVARDRALADVERNAALTQSSLEAALKQQKKLEQEKEFYLKKPMPPALQAQIKNNAEEVDALQQKVAGKDADIAAVRDRFAAEKQRYLELRNRKIRP